MLKTEIRFVYSIIKTFGRIHNIIIPVLYKLITQTFLDIFNCPSLRQDVLWYTNIRLSVRPFHMSRSNLRTSWPIHFKFQRVIGIDGLTVCILYGEISNFHSKVMGLYLSNCRRFSVCRTGNWEPFANSLQTSYCYWNW